MTRGRLLDRIRVVLAGRAAEQVALGEGDMSTYGTADLKVRHEWCRLIGCFVLPS